MSSATAMPWDVEVQDRLLVRGVVGIGASFSPALWQGRAGRGELHVGYQRHPPLPRAVGSARKLSPHHLREHKIELSIVVRHR